MSGNWTVRATGPLVLQRGDDVVHLRPKERAVVAALAMEHPTPLDTARIAQLIWAPAPPPTAHKSVQNHIARIRRAAPGVVASDGGTYRLAHGVLIEFDDHGRGDPFGDLPDSPELATMRHQVESRIEIAVDQNLERAVAAGITPELVERLRRSVADRPFNERRWFLLAAGHALTGRRRDALVVLQDARRALTEVGLVPSTQLIMLESRLATGDDIGVLLRTDLQQTAAPHVHQHRGEPFVGRVDELATLQRVWDSAIATRRPQLAVVSGLAGMGKSRLVDVLCDRLCAETTGTRVMWGRYREGSDGGFRPIIESLQRAIVHLDEPLPAPELERLGLGGAGARDGAPVRLSTSTAEIPHESDIADALRTVVGRIIVEPTVWLLDDVHWASEDAIELLRDALDGVQGPMLLALTRRTEVKPVSPALTGLQRALPTIALPIEPLNLDEVNTLVTAGQDQPAPDPAIVARLHRSTGGLPLFVSEIVRHSRRSGSDIAADLAPTTIHDWITAQVDRLDRPSRTVLELAAIVGTTVDVQVLDQVVDSDELSAALDDLVRRGLLSVRPGDAEPDLLEFAHAVTRDVVYESIGPASKRDGHRLVAEALERLATSRPHAIDHGQIALQFGRAGSPCADRAASHARDAARAALSLGSWAEADEWIQFAIDHDDGGEHHAEHLVWVGRIRTRQGRLDEASAALDEAIALARLTGAAHEQAAATLAFVGRAGRGATSAFDDARHTELLREAIDALHRRPGPAHRDRERSILLSDLERELAYALLLAGAEAERDRLLRSALERMCRLEPRDPHAFANALLGHRFAIFEPECIERRLSEIDDVLAMPRRDLGPEVLLTAHIYQCEEFLRLGRGANAIMALERAEEILQRHPHPYWVWATRTWRVIVDLIGGDLERAEDRAFEAFQDRPGVAGAEAGLGVHLVNIRLYQGRGDEMVELLQGAVAATPNIPAYRAVLSFCASNSGRPDLAEEHYAWFAENGFANLPDDTSRSLGLALLAHVASDLRDLDRVPVLDHLLAPAAGQWAVISCYGGGGATWGPTAHALARLADLQGQADRARSLIDVAADAATDAPLVLDRIIATRDSLGVGAADATTARQRD